MRALSVEQLRGLRKSFMGPISRQKTETDTSERTGYFLLMQHGDKVFLSQRPPVGLWGGLFCFPQFENEEALRECADPASD
jgi:adenine-specific DNA glycosylase